MAALSGGQQRRVLIARALAGRPELLVMDEPTAGVDHASQEALADVLHRLADRGTSMLIVTHELAALEGVVSRIVCLDGGHVDFDGDPAAYAAHLAAHSAGSGHHHPEQGARTGHVIGAAPLDPTPRRGVVVNDLLALDFMRQALLAALLAGFAAPLVGVFLVQRRMSLIGDGMGHVALAGVAVGVLTNQAPVLTALVAAVLAAVAIELIRASGRTSGDTALAVMFYGGIALGVVLIARSSAGTPATLTSYLFGAILTTTTSDIIVFAVLAAVVLATTLVLRPRFFAVANDEEYARAQGMPVLGYNVVLAVLTAVTVVVSMRIVGLLLISALMILPNATSQLFARSFRSALWWAVAIGVGCSVGGVVVSYYAETPSGGTIVLLAVGAFLVASTGAALAARARRAAHARSERHDHEHGPDCGHPAVEHGDHVDYLHGGHRHAAHEGHYDEHGQHVEHGQHAEVEPR